MQLRFLALIFSNKKEITEAALPSFITHTPSWASTALPTELDGACECLGPRGWKGHHIQLLLFTNIALKIKREREREYKLFMLHT